MPGPPRGRHTADAHRDASPAYGFRLFVAAGNAGARRAIANLDSLCEALGRPECEVEIVDVTRDPAAARDAMIIATPTLLRLRPEPVLRVIGDLSDREALLAGLELAEPAGPQETR